MEYLPFDCLIYIFDYLSMQDIISLRKTFTTFAEVVKYVRCNKQTVVYDKYEDVMYNGEMIYGFSNCILTNMIDGIIFDSYHNVTCEFNIPDMTMFNGVGSLTVRGGSFLDKPLDVKSLHIDVLHITKSNVNIEKLETLVVHGVSHCEDMKDLHNLKHLELRCSTKEISNMSSLKTLVANCNNLNSLPSLTDLTVIGHKAMDVSHITTLKRLDISDSRCVVPIIERLDYLNCDGRKDIESINIRYIDTLLANKCKSIDISYVKYIRVLDISNTSVTDISMLQDLEIVNISNTEVTSLPIPNKIVRLVAKDSKLTTLDYVNYLEYADISNTRVEVIPENKIVTFIASGSSIHNIDTLIEAETVDINFTRVNSLPNFNNIISFTAAHTDIKNIDCLIRAKHVNICHTQVDNLPKFERIESLNIGSTQASTIHNSFTLKTLNIRNTPKVSNILHLTSLVNLYARNSSIFSIITLKNLEKVDISETFVRDIPIPNKIREINLTNSRIRSNRGLENAKILKGGNMVI